MTDKREGIQASSPEAPDNKDTVKLLDKLYLLGLPIEKSKHFFDLPPEIQRRYIPILPIAPPPRGYTPISLSVYDVISKFTYPERINTTHPYHGSTGGLNFMVDEGGESWRCWRHGVTGGALHLFAISENIVKCEDVGSISRETWRAIFERARERGLLK